MNKRFSSVTKRRHSKLRVNDIVAPEILDRIFYWLSGDTQTLIACAVTCRLWLATCRPYLFHTVTLKNGDQCRRLLDVMDSSPIVSRHVRTLRVVQSFQDQMGPGYIPWVSVDFAPILPLALQKCEHLYFEGVNELWTIGSLHQLSHFSTVTELSLYRFATSVPELCAFISTFPNLERCIIRSFRDLGSGGVTFDDCSYLPGPRLKLLHIKSYHFPLASDDPFEQGFLEWVLGTESRYTLRDIAITAQNSNIEAVGDLLRVVGPQLEHLEIICQGLGSSRESRDDERIHNHLDLTRLTELRSLRLQYPTYIMIHALVSTITSPFLHTLSFQIRLRSTYNIVSGKHQSIAQLFGQKKLKDRLKLVRFDYESEHDAHMVQKLFEITYDDFLGPGVLQVNQVEGDMPDI